MINICLTCNVLEKKIFFLISVFWPPWRPTQSRRNGDIARSSSRVHISLSRFHFKYWGVKWAGGDDQPARPADDDWCRSVAVDGWTEFTADHLSAPCSTTDLTRRRRSRRVCHQSHCRVVHHSIHLHSISRLRVSLSSFHHESFFRALRWETEVKMHHSLHGNWNTVSQQN